MMMHNRVVAMFRLVALVGLTTSLFIQSSWAQPRPREFSIRDIYRNVVALLTVEIENDAEELDESFSAVEGTAFFISGDGYLLTNAHLVPPLDVCNIYAQSAGEIERGCDEGGSLFSREVRYRITGKIRDNEGKWQNERIHLIKSDMQTDIALLKIYDSDQDDPFRVPKFVELGNSDQVSIGDHLHMLVSSDRETIKQDSGLFSDRNAYRGRWHVDDIAINPGMSGSPVFNNSGFVVGIASAGLRGWDVEGVNYVTPMNLARPLLTIPGVHVHNAMQQIATSVRKIQTTLLWDVFTEAAVSSSRDGAGKEYSDINLVLTYQRLTDEVPPPSAIKVQIVPRVKIVDTSGFQPFTNSSFRHGFSVENIEAQLSGPTTTNSRVGVITVPNLIEYTVGKLCDEVKNPGETSKLLGWEAIRVVITSESSMSVQDKPAIARFVSTLQLGLLDGPFFERSNEICRQVG